MSREQRSESLDSIVTDDSEDPLTCPLTQRLFHDPVILVASGVTYEASALEECFGKLRRAVSLFVQPVRGGRLRRAGRLGPLGGVAALRRRLALRVAVTCVSCHMPSIMSAPCARDVPIDVPPSFECCTRAVCVTGGRLR